MLHSGSVTLFVENVLIMKLREIESKDLFVWININSFLSWTDIQIFLKILSSFLNLFLSMYLNNDLNWYKVLKLQQCFCEYFWE